MQGSAPEPCRSRHCQIQASWSHRTARREALRHPVGEDGATRRSLILDGNRRTPPNSERNPPTRLRDTPPWPTGSEAAGTIRLDRKDQGVDACGVRVSPLWRRRPAHVRPSVRRFFERSGPIEIITHDCERDFFYELYPLPINHQVGDRASGEKRLSRGRRTRCQRLRSLH